MSEPTVQDLTAQAAEAVANANAAVADPAPEPASTESAEPTAAEWQVILDALPESLIPTVTPAIEQYHQSQVSKYKELEQKYEPWKDLGFDPDEARQMQAFAQQFDADPLGVYEALEKHLLDAGLLEEAQQVADEAQAAQQAAGTTTPEPDEDDDPRFAALNQQLAVMAQGMQQLIDQQQQQYASAQEQEDQQVLETYLGELQSRHGELDMDYVTNLLAQGIDGDVAAKRWREKVEGIQADTTKPGDTAPVVMGGGGSLPSNRIPDVKNLSRGQLNDLVVQRLQADAQAAGG
jgi:hypothetical protein